MTKQELQKRKRQTSVAKDYQEFSHRLKMSGWNQPSADWKLRLEALVQFHPSHSTRQILNRAKLAS
ncbi:MAG: hypothetical protein KKF42_08995 [Actinobacteria bacterium]|nr:hypothetical protein [Actinomycetota bacterium]